MRIICLTLLLTACPTPSTNKDAGPRPDVAALDASLPDAASDASLPDASLPDAAAPDANLPDVAPPTDYYDAIDSTLQNQALVDALHTLLSDSHQTISYDDLIDAYLLTDQRAGCDGISDMYSNNCWDPADRCGNYNSEGDCYNREHSWPKSWWGRSETHPAYSDIVHVVPTDGFVNGQRGSLPFGNVGNASFTSSNGSKKGSCLEAEAGGDCFEPADQWKGDFARIHFYMAVRYEGDFSCCDREAVNRSDIELWSEGVLHSWHEQDPVDNVERRRNDAVFAVQGNRNPFVDHPEWVDQIADF